MQCALLLHDASWQTDCREGAGFIGHPPSNQLLSARPFYKRAVRNALMCFCINTNGLSDSFWDNVLELWWTIFLSVFACSPVNDCPVMPTGSRNLLALGPAL